MKKMSEKRNGTLITTFYKLVGIWELSPEIEPWGWSLGYGSSSISDFVKGPSIRGVRAR